MDSRIGAYVLFRISDPHAPFAQDKSDPGLVVAMDFLRGVGISCGQTPLTHSAAPLPALSGILRACRAGMINLFTSGIKLLRTAVI